MHPVYDDKCFTIPTVQVWCKKMLGRQKFAPATEMQSVILLWLGLQQASFFCIQKLDDRWDKCLKEFGRYVEKMKQKFLTFKEMTLTC